MKVCRTFLIGILFGLLAASAACAQSIVGAWTTGDTTGEGAAVIVFFANNTFIQIQNAKASEAPHGVDGFERGTYTWNPSTGAFTSTTIQDLNGDTGLSNLNGLPGITITVSGDTAAITIPGVGSASATRVTGTSPMSARGAFRALRPTARHLGVPSERHLFWPRMGIPRQRPATPAATTGSSTARTRGTLRLESSRRARRRHPTSTPTASGACLTRMEHSPYRPICSHSPLPTAKTRSRYRALALPRRRQSRPSPASG